MVYSLKATLPNKLGEAWGKKGRAKRKYYSDYYYLLYHIYCQSGIPPKKWRRKMSENPVN